jgi:hypothetical protein
MTAKNIIEQIEKVFGRQPEQYMFQLINDALDDIASNKRNYTVAATTDLEEKKRWYELSDNTIDITRVEILDTNNRYVMIPKLSDSHKLLRADTDETDDSLT